MTNSFPSSLVFLLAILVALTQNHFSNGKFFGGRRRGPRPGSFLGGNLFLPRENITLTNLTCAADAPPPITCGRRGNATGILACRTRTKRRRQGGPLGFFGGGGGGFTTVTTNTTRCVDPSRARESDTCGCCLDEMDRCPTAPCGCPCNIMDRNGNVIGTGVNVTFVGRRRRRGGRFGGRLRGRRRRGGSKCVSVEDSVTLQLFRGMECVAADVCETSTTDVVDSP